MTKTTIAPALDISRLSEITLAVINARLDGAGEGTAAAFDHVGGLTNMIFELLAIDLRSGGTAISRASADLVLTALRESGYLPPDNASDADIVRLLDETGASFSRSAAEADAHARALLQAAAVAMRAGDPFAAMTFIDGPEGAGIGWQLTRDEVQKRITERTPVKT